MRKKEEKPADRIPFGLIAPQDSPVSSAGMAHLHSTQTI